jgi:hypothetical protein
MPRRKNKKTSKKKRRQDGANVMGLVRSFPGQPVAEHWVSTFNTLLTGTVTTGVVSSVISMNPVALVTNWATRFQTLYEEYRVKAVRARVLCASGSNTGTLLCYWDEKSNTAPSNASASQEAMKRICNGDVYKEHIMTWHAKDLLDLEYTAIGTAVNPVYWKLYTDTANNAAPPLAQPFCTVDFRLTIQFRGFI